MIYTNASESAAAVPQAVEAMRRNRLAISRLPYVIFAVHGGSRQITEGESNHASADALARAGSGSAVRSMSIDYADPQRGYRPTGDGVAWIRRRCGVRHL